MLQDHSRNRTPMPAAQPPADTAPPEPGPARAEAGIARMLLASADAEPAQPDPILGVIEVWRKRTAAYDAFDAQVDAGSFVGSKISEEDRLIAELTPARDAVLATVPTTPVGRAALVQFVRDEIAASGMADGGPPDDDHPVWRDGLRALLAAQEAEIRAAAPVLPDHETRFLALIPWFARVVPEGEEARNRASRLHEEGMAVAGEAWSPALEKAWRENGYSAAADLANDLDEPIAVAFEPFMSLPMTTLPALAWKARVSLYLFDGAEEALSDLAALAVAVSPHPAVGGEVHPDNALLAMGPTITELAGRRDSLYPASRDTELAAMRVVGQAPEAHTQECRDWFARLRAEQARNGHDTANAAYNAADSELLDALIDLAEIRAATMDGLIFKARLAHEHEVEEIASGIVANLIAMEKTKEGRQVRPSLSDQIIACWREWAALIDFDKTEQGLAANERLDAERSALCAAAEALPVGLGNVPAKALALAWLQYSDLWHHGDDREAYHIDGRLALDIDTAICGRLKTHYTGEAA
ncbi:MAG: hypothetical protein PGN25_05270 [Methylorubrum populi]